MKKHDYTRLAILDCIHALSCPGWIIRLIPTIQADHIISVEYKHAQFCKPDTARFLRAKNAGGYHCYFRPNIARHILVDDVDAYSLERMAADGLQPALVVCTSPDNYQAWVTLNRRENIDTGLATSASKILAHRYGGDMNSAKATQLGRIPGLTNRKPEHQMANGHYPWTHVIGYPHPRTAPGAADLLKEARLSPYFLSYTQGACVHHNSSNNSTSMTPDEGIEIYNHALTELHKSGWLDQLDDRSLVDFSVAKYLLIPREGNYFAYHLEEVAAVILYGSDKGRERGEEYAIQTAQRAYERIRKQQCEAA